MSLYIAPGASVVEQIIYAGTAPQISPSSNVCIVAPVQGFQTATDQILVSGTTANTLPTLVANPGATLVAVTSVTNVLNPTSAGYALTTDYTVNTGTGTITAVATGSGGTIPYSGGVLLYVTYTYIPLGYFNAVMLNSLGAVQSLYGPAFNTAGTAISSPMSFAALNAFQNGAGSVICQPLFVRATPGNPTTAQGQPNATQIATASTWADTLYVLRNYNNIDIIVPIIGQSWTSVTDSVQLSVFEAVQDHETFMNGQEQFIFGIFGEDSSSSNSVAQMATIRSHASTLESRYAGALNQQNVMINTSNFQVPLPSSNQNGLAVGGQYMAAAVAGALAARPVSASLCRQTISGFSAVLDYRQLSDKNTDAGDGLMVMEQLTNSQTVRCRDDLTMDSTGAARSSLSVVRAKFQMIESVKATLENQIIGQIIADSNSPYVVRSAISGVLSQLQQAGSLISYSVPVCSLISLNPTVITATFSYRPAFTVKYVNVTFSLDLTNSVVTTSDSTTTS
jgi:hypothetical protein